MKLKECNEEQLLIQVIYVILKHRALMETDFQKELKEMKLSNGKEKRS